MRECIEMSKSPFDFVLKSNNSAAVTLDKNELENLKVLTIDYLTNMTTLCKIKPNIKDMKKYVRNGISRAIRSKDLCIPGMLLTPSNTLIDDTETHRNKFHTGGFSIVDNVVLRNDSDELPNSIERDSYDNFHPNLYDSKETKTDKRLANEYQRYLRKNPFKSPSTTTSVVREMFTGISDLHETILSIHHRQTHQYRFDILIGTQLQHVETQELRVFYPALNTSLFYDQVKPLINTSVTELLDQITLDLMLEKLKRPSSKWKLLSIYEYVILISSIPDVLIGANIKLPELLKKSKSVISLENVQ